MSGGAGKGAVEKKKDRRASGRKGDDDDDDDHDDTFDLITMGRAGLDLYSLDYGKRLVDASRFAKYVGGSAANVAVGASRLGLRTALVTKVSDDALGEFVAGYLQRERVETRYVGRDREGKLGIVFAEILPGRDDADFIFYRESAADLRLREDEIPFHTIERSRYFLVTGTGLSASPSFQATVSAMRRCHDRPAGSATPPPTVVLNLDWRPSLWRGSASSSHVENYSAALQLAHLVVGNEEEHLVATGSGNIDEALQRVFSVGVKLDLVTMGSAGTLVATTSGRKVVPGFRIQPLKGLGAGDGFIAGFIFGMRSGWGPERSALVGNAVGAIVTTRHACADGMPTYGEVVRFMQDHDSGAR